MPSDASASGPKKEVEIKLRLTGVDEGRRRLRQAGFRVSRRRVFERNTIFDTPGQALRRRGLLLRLRTSGARSLVTFKGPTERGKHKIRKEIEFELRGGSEACAEVFEALGYRPVFLYEKYRTEYVLKPASAGRAMLDETPVGVFLELEGPPQWIDRTARRLGFREADYITATYAELHRSAGRGRRDMLF
ncbi:MAG: class IV adenylate cyclase [Bryobacteraceae bacterium]